MSAYFFYPSSPITNPTLNNIYSQESHYYDYEKLQIVTISAKTGGYWKTPYLEAGKLYQSTNGVTQFISPLVMEDPYNEYAEKFINFVCMGKVHIECVNKSSNIIKITRPGNKEFIIWVESGNEYVEVSGELLNDIKQFLPPLILR